MTATRLEPARKRHGLNLTFFAAGLRDKFLRGPNVAACQLPEFWTLKLCRKSEIQRRGKLTLSKPSKMDFPNSQISHMNFPVACRNNIRLPAKKTLHARIPQ